MPVRSPRQLKRTKFQDLSANRETADRNLASLAQLPITVVIGAIWMVLVDSPRLIQLGPLSISGAVTVALAVLTLFLLPGYAIPAVTPSSYRRVQSAASSAQTGVIPWPLWGFLLLLALSLISTIMAGGFSSEPIQNSCVYLLFVGAIVLAASAGSQSVVIRGWELFRTVATWFAYFSLAITVVGQVGHTNDRILSILFTPRGMAMVGLIVLALVIPGAPRNKWMEFAPFAMITAMTLSLSRTSTAVGLALMVFLVVRKRSQGSKPKGRGFKALAMIVTVAASAYLLVLYYAPLRDRFLRNHDAVEIGGLTISTEGRAKMWGLILSESHEKPFLGHGVGAASQLITQYYPGLDHPHNEYLRFYFDFGLIGLGLFAVGYIAIALRVFRYARRSDHPVHWAALIALIGIALVAVTDNAMVYPFVMIPLGSIVGLSFAMRRFELTEFTSRRTNSRARKIDDPVASRK